MLKRSLMRPFCLPYATQSSLFSVMSRLHVDKNEAVPEADYNITGIVQFLARPFVATLTNDLE